MKHTLLLKTYNSLWQLIIISLWHNLVKYGTLRPLSLLCIYIIFPQPEHWQKKSQFITICNLSHTSDRLMYDSSWTSSRPSLIMVLSGAHHCWYVASGILFQVNSHMDGKKQKTCSCTDLWQREVNCSEESPKRDYWSTCFHDTAATENR